MRLVACTRCHAQFDVAAAAGARFACHCGTTVETTAPEPIDAPVHRCAACGASLDEATADACGYCGAGVVRDPLRLSLVCPECYARNPEAARFCGHCAVRFEPQPLPMAGGGLPCPACAQPMTVRTVAGIGAQECPACHGLWVARDGLTTLVDRSVRTPESPAPAAAPPRRVVPATVVYRRCPVCRGHMQRRNFGRTSGVILDWCGEHGTWLDADELAAIATFVQHGGTTPAASATPETDPVRLLLAAAEREESIAHALATALRRRTQPQGEPPWD